MKKNLSVLIALLFFSIQCSHLGVTDRSENKTSQSSAGTSSNVGRNLAEATDEELAAEAAFTDDNSINTTDWIAELPGDKNEYYDFVSKKLAPSLKEVKVTAAEKKVYAERISKYLSFLMKGYEESTKRTNPKINKIEIKLAKEKAISKIISRLLNSSTQFILCPDLADYECLEKTPIIAPRSATRKENPNDKLGEKVVIDAGLEESSEWFFTTQFLLPENQVDLSKSLASKLAEKIKTEGRDEVLMALYGIDDIDGSMKEVYQTVIDKIDSNVKVKAVFDQNGLNPGVQGPLLFSYVKPAKGKNYDNWILKPISDIKTNMAFQYNGGTQGLVNALSAGAKTEEQALGRIESKNEGIMHNKYFVFKNGNDYSVWTGTANVARTCMGTERNSNMGFFIKNKEVAESFINEFNEMYEYQPDGTAGSKDFTGLKTATYPMGRFHGMKRPNTKRLFYFQKDNTDLKVYFSPTDDAEHRAILPMLHSAKMGDIIRVSMFGAAGIDYVRAFQLAASRGVKIEIILDTPTGFATGSWAAAKADATLLEKNPFGSGFIQLKKNAKAKEGVWKQNHQKIGVLLRKTKGSYRAEQLIFGSQNWSASGNDKNDENLITLRNRSKGLKMGEDFNTHFTDLLWRNAVDINAPEAVGVEADAELDPDAGE